MRDLDLNDPAVLEHSLVVSASAGSGKTFTLTVLVSALLGKEGARPHEILATTFGENASSDLRSRLLRPLDLLATLDENAWTGLLPMLGGRDGFGVEDFLATAGLPPRLLKSAQEVAQASTHWLGASWAATPALSRAFWRRIRREAELLQVSTIHSLALGLLRQGEGAPEAILDAAHPALLRTLRDALRTALDLPSGHPDQVPARVLLAWAERNWADISNGHDSHRDAMGEPGNRDRAVLRTDLLAALEQAEEALRPFSERPELAKESSAKTQRNFKNSMLLPIPGARAPLAQRIRWAVNQSEAISLDPEAGVPRSYFSTAFHAPYQTLGAVADAWEAWLRSLLEGALAVFEEEKAVRGQATFGDMVRKALDGLGAGAIEPPRPKLLLVDEYQDTSRAQDAFLEALGAERSVRVGDLKQAIYGFRGGDPDLLRLKLREAGDQAFRLPSNFRSSPAVVALANRFVGEVWLRLDPDAGELDGNQAAVSRSGLRVGIHRSAAPSRGVDLLGIADWIGALSSEEGWNRDLGQPAKSAPRRRALLLRQRTRLPELLLALKKHGIQPYVVAKDGFWDSPGVRLLMAALEAVAHPDRSIPCVVLLRMIIGLGDNELTALTERSGGRRGFGGLGNLEPNVFPLKYQAGVEWLQALGPGSTQEIAGRMLAQGALLGFLRAQRAHGALEPVRARRNLAALLARILALPASPSAAFALLDEERSGPEKGDLPAPAEGADLIIQTVHASKGLEYDDVILPLMNGQPQPLKHGTLRTLPGMKELLLAWKLGQHPGAAYRILKPLVAERQRRDDLNLLYVGLTRAKERMALMIQAPPTIRPAEGCNTWAQMAHYLAEAHQGELTVLEAAPEVQAKAEEAEPEVPAPLGRTVLQVAEECGATDEIGSHHAAAKARRDGEAMHAFLRDLLVRWEAPDAFHACLSTPPPVAKAREVAHRFLDQFETRGWRGLRRRTEYPIVGAAASGAEGRADLVVWEGDRIHLLDFKHSHAFGAEDLEAYGRQLQRYAHALAERYGVPVEAWLIALKSGDWVSVPIPANLQVSRPLDPAYQPFQESK